MRFFLFYSVMRELLKKIKRELIAGLSKIYIRSVNSNYLGLNLKIPLIYGMRNGGYIVPAEFWMSYCLEAFIKTKQGCVIDVGANVGLYLVKLKAMSDQVPYYGVDSNPACIFYTQELIRLNHFKQAKLFTTALSDNANVLDFYTNSHDDRMGSLIKEHHTYKKDFSFSVLSMTGDNLVKMLKITQISVIKIDVEGAEQQVLQGIKGTIEKYRPYIYIEILQTDTLDKTNSVIEICQSIQALDYNILGVNSTSQKTEVITDIHQVGKNYEANYVFAPNNLLDAFTNCLNKVCQSQEI